jgi:hypothetical protein
MRGVARVLLGAVTFAALGATAVADQYDRRIIYADDKLTVHLSAVPIEEVLAEIERQSGAEVDGHVRNPRPVSADFADVPIADALERLLGGQSFALIYGTDGGLKALRLRGGPQTAPASHAPSAVSPAMLGEMFERHEPVPVQGRLAQALGAPKATFAQLAEAALHNENAAVRNEAVRTATLALEGDTELRSAVTSFVAGIADPELGKIVRGYAGARAEELVLHVLAVTRASEFRTRGAAVLQQLRANPAQPGG